MTKTSKTFLVTAISENEAGELQFNELGSFPTKPAASKAARNAAGKGSEWANYGPSSFCYVGKEVTAVVAW